MDLKSDIKIVARFIFSIEIKSKQKAILFSV